MIIVERATSVHAGSLNELLQNQFAEHGITLETEGLALAIQEMLRRSELGMFLVARKNDQVIGCAAISYAWTLEHGGKSAWLDELYVLPAYRGQGIGSLLVDRAVAEAQSEGCKAMDLEVEEEHVRAERLYARKGFRPLRRRRWVKPLGNAPHVES